MDIIRDGKVLGSIDGVLVNNQSLVPGKSQIALSFNGVDQAVNLGMHMNECFHTRKMCTAGSTFAYWLKWEPLKRVGLIFETGGWFDSSHCYSHQINSDGNMKIFIKDHAAYYDFETFVGNPTQWLFIVTTWSTSVGIKLYGNTKIFIKDHAAYYDFEIFVANPTQWLFIVTTWSTSVGIKLYLNGCPFRDDVVTMDIRTRTKADLGDRPFMIGEPSDGSPYRANMTLDNFMAWNEETDADEVWQLYIQAQAGQV